MNPKRDIQLAWLVNIFAAGYVAWTGYTFTTRIPQFAVVFSGLGASLPFPTRVVLAAGNPSVIWPLTVAAVAFLLGKEIRIPSVRTRVLLTLVVFFATAMIAALVTEALFRPMLHIIQQVG